MREIQYSVQGVTFKRVSKSMARRAYDDGKLVTISGSKERVGYTYGRNKDFGDCTDTFDNWVNAWIFYNRSYYGYPMFFIVDTTK